MNPVVRFVGNESAIARHYQIGISVAKLVSDDSGFVSVPKCLNRVNVSPVVERDVRKSQEPHGSLVDSQCLGFGYPLEDESVRREVSRVSCEDFPRPQLGSSDSTVSPSGFPALCVSGLGGEINVPASDTFDNLPLNARSGHKSLERTVGHIQGVYECLGLSTLKPDDSIAGFPESSHVADGVVFQYFPLDKPAGKDGKSGAVAVLCGVLDGEPVEKFADCFPSESGRSELRSQHSANLRLGFLITAPLVQERNKVRFRESGKELIELAPLVSGEDFGQRDFLIDDQFQREPDVLSRKVVAHPFHRLSGGEIVSPAASNNLPPIGKPDAGFPVIAAFGFERHQAAKVAGNPSVCNSGSNPASFGAIPEMLVSLYPERDSNSYADLTAGDFESHYSLLGNPNFAYENAGHNRTELATKRHPRSTPKVTRCGRLSLIWDARR